MSELIEMLTTKKNKAEELYKSLGELLEGKYKELEDEKRKYLPKFGEKLDEKGINEYLERLTKAVKNPIRSRRKRSLIELGVIGIENVKDEIFDDDSIEETIQILKELRSYERLFKILSREVSSAIVQEDISNINSWLVDIRNNIENLKKVEEVKSRSVKEYCLRNYIKKELDVYGIYEIKEKVIKIEDTLNLHIKQEEISLINEIDTFIGDIKEFGEEFKGQCKDLNDARGKVKSFKNGLEEEFKQIKKEIDFWHQLFPDAYVPEIKNISSLRDKLGELKEKCKRRYNSFTLLEQIYKQNLEEEIENPREFASKIENVISYFPNLEIKNEEDFNTIEKVYNSIEWLKEIKYQNIEELCKELTFENIEEFFRKVNQIKEDYKRLKEDLKAYERILGVGEEQSDAYPLLKQKIDEYRDKLRGDIGEGFESLLSFLKGKTENIKVDKQTLKNFIKTVRPILKEALKI